MRRHHPSRAGWAEEEGTGCWSGQEVSRQCCGLLVSMQWSTAGLELGICCRKQTSAVNSTAMTSFKHKYKMLSWLVDAEDGGTETETWDSLCNFLRKS